MAHGKAYTQAANKIDTNKVYSLAEALSLARETNPVKFDASVELHVRLGINVEQAEEQIRGTVVLPHGTGREKRVAVFTERYQDEARKAGVSSTPTMFINGRQLSGNQPYTVIRDIIEDELKRQAGK